MFKKILIFDLDQTVIDSSHRTPLKEDGTLDLDKYFFLNTCSNIFKDTLLPLADFMKRMYNNENYIVVCTARMITEHDLAYLRNNNLQYHKIVHRKPCHMYLSDGQMKEKLLNYIFTLKQFSKLPKYMWDDNPKVLKTLRKKIPVFNSLKVNKRLGYRY